MSSVMSSDCADDVLANVFSGFSTLLSVVGRLSLEFLSIVVVKFY